MRHLLCMILAFSAVAFFIACESRDDTKPEPEQIVPAPHQPIVPPDINEDEPAEVSQRCETTAQAELAAFKAAEAWLRLVDSGYYEASWDEAAGDFKHAVPKENWQRLLGAFRTPLGRAVVRQLKSREYAACLPGAPDGQYVVIQYESSFENKTTAVETVTPMRDTDGQWRVSGYYVK